MEINDSKENYLNQMDIRMKGGDKKEKMGEKYFKALEKSSYELKLDFSKWFLLMFLWCQSKSINQYF